MLFCLRDYCKRHGGHLVEISSREIQHFIMTILSSVLHYDEDALWIGLNDRDTEHTWVWDNGRSNAEMKQKFT